MLVVFAPCSTTSVDKHCCLAIRGTRVDLPEGDSHMMPLLICPVELSDNQQMAYSIQRHWISSWWICGWQYATVEPEPKLVR